MIDVPRPPAASRAKIADVNRHRGRSLTAWAQEMTAQGYSARTIESMVGAVRGCARSAGVEADQLTREQVVAWLGARERATWTRIKYVSWITSWAAYLGRPELVDGLRRPKTPDGIPRPVQEPALMLMLRAARGRTRAWVLLGAYCGLRAHESAKVAVEDLELLPQGEHVLRVTGKGGRTAVVPCPPIVVRELEKAAAAVGGHGRLWPLASSRTVQRAVRTLAAKAGVRCTSHQLRHRYGTAFYGVSRDILATQQAMRHRSPATTAGYAMVAGDRVAAIAASLPGALDGEPTERPVLRLVR